MVEAVLLLDLLHFLLRGIVAGCSAVGPFDTEGVVLVFFQVFVDLGELLVFFGFFDFVVALGEGVSVPSVELGRRDTEGLGGVLEFVGGEGTGAYADGEGGQEDREDA